MSFESKGYADWRRSGFNANQRLDLPKTEIVLRNLVGPMTQHTEIYTDADGVFTDALFHPSTMNRNDDADQLLSPKTATKPSATLLEDCSMHMTLNSEKGWQCSGCNCQNLSAVQNECSICGMQRSYSTTYEDDSFHEDSLHNSSNSLLSLHNSVLFPSADDQLQELHRSTGNFNASMASLRSTRSTRSQLSTRPATEVMNASMVSFSDWNANVTPEAWTCTACTFCNPPSLQLVCNMCGTHRQTVMDYSSDDDDDAFVQREQMRELIQVQHELLQGYSRGSQQRTVETFDTQDLQREIAVLVSPRRPTTPSRRPGTPGTPSRQPRGTPGSRSGTPGRSRTGTPGRRPPKTPTRRPRRRGAHRTPSRSTPGSRTPDTPTARTVSVHARHLPQLIMSPLPMEDTNDDPTPNIDELLSCTRNMLAEFQSSSPQVSTMKTTTPTMPAMANATNESCLQYRMQRAGGKLQVTDLVLPVLWGDAGVSSQAIFDNNDLGKIK